VETLSKQENEKTWGIAAHFNEENEQADQDLLEKYKINDT